MEKSESIINLTKRIYKAFETKDTEFFKNIWSTQDGVLAIGTDPKEWWKGSDHISSIFKKQLAEMKGFKLVESNPEAYESGNTGWFADQVVWDFEGTKMPMRLTSVFVKEGNDWKCTQWHASMGVSNEEAIGRELPTS